MSAWVALAMALPALARPVRAVVSRSRPDGRARLDGGRALHRRRSCDLRRRRLRRAPRADPARHPRGLRRRRGLRAAEPLGRRRSCDRARDDRDARPLQRPRRQPEHDVDAARTGGAARDLGVPRVGEARQGRRRRRRSSCSTARSWRPARAARSSAPSRARSSSAWRSATGGRSLAVAGFAVLVLAVNAALTQVPQPADKDPILNPEFGAREPIGPADAQFILPLESEIDFPSLGASREAAPPLRDERPADARASGALEQAAERPVVGYGFGTEERAFVDRYYNFTAERVENAYVAMALQLGVVGVALLLAFLGLTAVRGVQLVRRLGRLRAACHRRGARRVRRRARARRDAVVHDVGRKSGDGAVLAGDVPARRRHAGNRSSSASAPNVMSAR